MSPSSLFHALLLCVLAALLKGGLQVSADATPIQQRLALVPGGMTVSWSTVGPINVTAMVAYGTTPATVGGNASGITLNYNPSTTWFHHVTIYNLAPATTYYWKVISPVGVNSSVLSFITAPVVGDRAPYNISINGDMGIAVDNGTLLSMQSMLPSINYFWHVGDLSYADGRLLLQQPTAQHKHSALVVNSPSYLSTSPMVLQRFTQTTYLRIRTWPPPLATLRSSMQRMRGSLSRG